MVHEGDLMLDEGTLALDDNYKRLVTVSMIHLHTVCDVPKSHSRVMHGRMRWAGFAGRRFNAEYDVPGAADGIKRTPAMVGPKHGGLIPADAPADDIPVLDVEIGDREFRKSRLFLRHRKGRGRRGRARQILQILAQRKRVTVRLQRIIFIVV